MSRKELFWVCGWVSSESAGESGRKKQSCCKRRRGRKREKKAISCAKMCSPDLYIFFPVALPNCGKWIFIKLVSSTWRVKVSLKTENKHFARRRGGKPPCHTFGSTLFCCSERCAGGFNVEGEGWDPSLGSPPRRTRWWEKCRTFVCAGKEPWEGACGLGSSADLPLNAKIANMPWERRGKKKVIKCRETQQWFILH